jgi:glutamate racemase
MLTQLSQPFDVVFTDSCIGGSTVASKLGAKSSGLRGLYLADYAINPLGVRSAEGIGAVVQRWVSAAASCSPLLIIACNTASVSVHRAGKLNEPVSGGGLVVVTMVELVGRVLEGHRTQLAGKRVGLLGTKFTTTERLYQELIVAAGAGEVDACAATQTEHAVAAFQYASASASAVIVDEIGAFVQGCDAVLLGCTCFPFIAPLIRRLNPGCLILDPAAAVQDVRTSPARSGENVMTIAVSGPEAAVKTVARNAVTLFPTWNIERVVPFDSPAEVMR